MHKSYIMGGFMKPLIFDFALHRRKEQAPKFEYDYELNLNVIRRKDYKIPFVNTGHSSLELMTKTKEIPREDDDENPSSLELLTKTYVEKERDDEDDSIMLELMTKTKIDRERDDEDDTIYYK